MSAKKKNGPANKHKTMIFTYKTYTLVDGKDPFIYELMTRFDDDGRKLHAVADSAGVSDTTVRNWFYGETRRPSNAAMEAFARALGYKRKLVKWDGKE